MNLGIVAAFIIGMAHIVCGWLVGTEPAVARVTPLHLLGRLCEPLQPGGTEMALSAVLLSVGVAAVIGVFVSATSPWRFWLLVPQQGVLGLQLISINLAVWNGIYPDGYMPAGGWRFILGDQIWALGLSSAYVIIAIWLMARRHGGG